MFSKQFFLSNYIDIINTLLILVLCSIGLLFIYSSTYNTTHPFSIFFKKQLFGIVSGFIIYFVCTLLSYQVSMRLGYFGYVALLFLLAFTLIKGTMGMGAKRWISLLFFKFQPSEIAKLFFPAFAAYIFKYNEEDHITFRSFSYVLIVLLISVLLIFKQPDLGTAIIIFATGLIICWLAGLSKYFFIALTSFFIITAPICWQFLKTYQKQRILVFLGYGESKKERYQIEQAFIAIGSGGMWGKGLLRGTQNKLHFLPEGRTDFIFAIVCEEWGFAGALLILICYVCLVIRLCLSASRLKDWIMQLFAIGVITPFILSIIINIGMVLGLVPIVGIPLPLLSYGISNLWITFASLGIFQNLTRPSLYISD